MCGHFIKNNFAGLLSIGFLFCHINAHPDFIENILSEDNSQLALPSRARAYTGNSETELNKIVQDNALFHCKREGFDDVADFKLVNYFGVINNQTLVPKWKYQLRPNYLKAARYGLISVASGIAIGTYFSNYSEQQVPSDFETLLLGFGSLSMSFYASKVVKNLLCSDLTSAEIDAYREQGLSEYLSIKYLDIHDTPHLVFSELKCRLSSDSIIQILSQNDFIAPELGEDLKRHLRDLQEQKTELSLTSIILEGIAKRIYHEFGFKRFQRIEICE
jgi:hypothetical protein